MKIDICLLASDLKRDYIELLPIAIDTWKKIIGIQVIVILISEFIPNELKKYEDEIILFKPIEGIHTAFQAQCIRILYPAILECENGVIISDADMIPLNKRYFIDSIKNIDDSNFITYRDVLLENKQVAICYNVANPRIWKEVFQIENIDDITKLLKEWYANINGKYTGLRKCRGWHTDQDQLYIHLKKWNSDRWIVLDIRLNRLSRIRARPAILKNRECVSKYTDYHHRPINKITLDDLKIFVDSIE